MSEESLKLNESAGTGIGPTRLNMGYRTVSPTELETERISTARLISVSEARLTTLIRNLATDHQASQASLESTLHTAVNQLLSIQNEHFASLSRQLDHSHSDTIRVLMETSRRQSEFLYALESSIWARLDRMERRTFIGLFRFLWKKCFSRGV